MFGKKKQPPKEKCLACTNGEVSQFIKGRFVITRCRVCGGSGYV